MIFKKEQINGLWVFIPEQKKDERGFFGRTYCTKELKKHRLKFNIVQINISSTYRKGTIRGMHFQEEPHAEAKIVQCLKGKIYDVVIDIRKDSKTYGKWSSLELSEENKKMLFVPKGFAHGFQTLENNCLVQYFISEYYSSSHACGVRWNDHFFSIEWPIKNPTLSNKDKNWKLI